MSTKTLFQQIHEETKLTEAASKPSIDGLLDPENVIGLHPDGYEGFKKYISRLDPNNPHDLKILRRIESGD